jgi:hypothetical protein
MLRRRRDNDDLRWLTARAWTTRWYPQGIDIGVHDGRRTLAVSWFRQEKDGRHLASRVVLIDTERSRQIDVALAFEDDDGTLVPARIHTGGLAWFGDRLFVAATGQGIWEFDLSSIRHVRGPLARTLRGLGGRGFARSARVAVRTRVHPVDLRCSFLGRVFDEDGTPLARVLIGEYTRERTGRVGEFSLPEGDDGSFAEHGTFVPDIARMQGAVRWGGRYFLSQSRAMQPGALWTGAPDGLARHEVPLPVGCEDLALDPEARMLWTLGEHPFRRVVRGIPFARLGLGD